MNTMIMRKLKSCHQNIVKNQSEAEFYMKKVGF